MSGSGFESVSVYPGIKGKFHALPLAPLSIVENLLERVPRRLRKVVVNTPVVAHCLLAAVLARKGF